MVEYDNSYGVVYLDVSHGNRQYYEFNRLDKYCNLVETIELHADYDQEITDADAEFTLNGETITYDQYLETLHYYYD